MEAAAASARPVLRVAAICGSLRKASFNRGLLRAGMLPLLLLLPRVVPITTQYSRLRFLVQLTTRQPRRCARTPSRGSASTSSTSPTCPSSTPTSRRAAAPASRPPSRPSAPRSARPTASSSARPSTTTPSPVRPSPPSLLPALLLVRFRIQISCLHAPIGGGFPWIKCSGSGVFWAWNSCYKL